MSHWDDLMRDYRRETPLAVLLLGACPVIAPSTTLKTGVIMGIASLAVILLSGFAVSLLRRWIPIATRSAVVLVITTSFATAVYALLQAVAPGTCGLLGLYLPLLGANVLMLTRTERYAAHQGRQHAILDALVLGGLVLAISITVGAARELLGQGSIGGMAVFAQDAHVKILSLAPGAFFAAAAIALLVNRARIKKGLRPL